MIEQTYVPEKIVSYVWGYEQTNVDWFKIIKRKNEYVTLQPLKSIEKSNDALTMTGTCIPGEIDPKGKIIRRKIHYRDNKESGLAINSYGWAQLWDGLPEHFSTYG